MHLLAQGQPQQPIPLSTLITIVVIFAALIFLIVAIAVFTKYFRLWIQSKMTRAGIGIFDLLGMTFRKVDPRVIVRGKIMAVQATPSALSPFAPRKWRDFRGAKGDNSDWPILTLDKADDNPVAVSFDHLDLGPPAARTRRPS